MNRLSAGLLAAGVLAAAAPGARAAEHPQTAFINEQIAAKWKEAEIKKPAAKATDHEFLRRVFIDLIGRVATPEEVIDFEQDAATDKRAKLVKRLLYATEYKPKVNGSPVKLAKDKVLTFDYAGEYAGHWTNIWTVWLMSRTGDYRYRDQMQVWLQKAFLDNVSYKDMVTQLLTATGKTNENGAVNFVLHHLGENNPPEKKAELGPFDAVPITSRVTRLFLGLQTQCTQCHDHPFNKEWVQSDFWGVNAFFRQTTRDKTPTRQVPGQMMAALVQVDLADDPALNPSARIYYDRRDGKMMATRPTPLKDVAQAEKGESSPKSPSGSGSAGKTRRQALAEAVVGHDNFSRAYVSRVWGHLFGRGLHKEPAVDDFGNFSGENPVVHPELLNRLAEDFAKYKYDPKMLLEWVCTSDVYQLSHVGNKEYADAKFDPYFARMPLKALSPEVLFESLMTATRAEFTANGDERKKLREGWMGKLVRNFGDDEGNELTFNGTVVQALLMMNGRELNEQIGAKGANAVQRVLEKHSKGGGTSADGVIGELFLMTLNRRPTGAELAKLKSVQQQGAAIKAEAPKESGGDKPAKPGAKPKPAPKGGGIAGYVAGTTASDVTFYQDVFWALLNTNEFMLNH